MVLGTLRGAAMRKKSSGAPAMPSDLFPDLGKYAIYVLGSYAAAIAILGAVLGSSLRASIRARRELAAQEARKGPRRKR